MNRFVKGYCVCDRVCTGVYACVRVCVRVCCRAVCHSSAVVTVITFSRPAKHTCKQEGKQLICIQRFLICIRRFRGDAVTASALPVTSGRGHIYFLLRNPSPCGASGWGKPPGIRNIMGGRFIHAAIAGKLRVVSLCKLGVLAGLRLPT